VRWRAGKKTGRTLYKDGRLVGVLDTPELAAEIVAALNATETLPPPPPAGSYAHSSPESSPPADVVAIPPAPKTVPTMPAFRAEEKVPMRRTESGLREALHRHHARCVREEVAAVLVHEAYLERLRKDPKVARYLEAVEDLRNAALRRDRAARDLGFLIADGRAITGE